MPLTSFGAVMGFAEQIESGDRDFYLALSETPGLTALRRDLIRRMADDSGKNVEAVRRIRRENVTEMILEPISGLERGPFMTGPADPQAVGAEGALEACRALEDRAARFYREAAIKIGALPEAARALKRLGARRTANLDRLAARSDD